MQTNFPVNFLTCRDMCTDVEIFNYVLFCFGAGTFSNLQILNSCLTVNSVLCFVLVWCFLSALFLILVPSVQYPEYEKEVMEALLEIFLGSPLGWKSF